MMKSAALVLCVIMQLWISGNAFIRSAYDGRSLHTRYGLCIGTSRKARIVENNIVPSLRLHLASSDESSSPIAADIDDDLDFEMSIALSARGTEVFDTLTSQRITKDSILEWERKIDLITADIRLLTNKSIIFKLYKSILSKAAPLELDPIQMTSFEVLSTALADALLRNYPKNQPLTELIDEVTDMHLEFIEHFVQTIGEVDEEGYSVTESVDWQEFLCYQLAGLVRFMYIKLSARLGDEFDKSDDVQNLRLNNWVSPVYARIQRRFVRFISVEVDERLEDIRSESFDKLMRKLKVELAPRYLLSGPIDTAAYANRYQPELNEIDSSDEVFEYPPWELANFVLKVLRNALMNTDIDDALEGKVNMLFRQDIATRMHSISPKLEKMRNSQQRRLSVPTAEESAWVEEMLNLGHESVAGVIALWQVRCNIVGVSDATTDGSVKKDFIRSVTLSRGKDRMLAALPVKLRQPAESALEELEEDFEADPVLTAATLLSYAVREGASDNFRALTLYNLDSSNHPESRDDIYIAVLGIFLSEILLAPVFLQHWLYENLVAFAALEETIGVREPRASCAESFATALSLTALRCIDTETSSSAAAVVSVPEDLAHRVSEVEKALSMLLRLPDNAGGNARMLAFKRTVDTFLNTPTSTTTSTAASAMNSDGVTSTGRLGGLQLVNQEYERIAEIVGISKTTALNYVKPLGQQRFDRTVGDLLMNADIAVSMPELGSQFEEQVTEIASQVMMDPLEAEQRVGFLAGTVLCAFIETAIQENRKMNTGRADGLLQRSYTMYRHPLLLQIGAKKDGGDAELQMIAVRMVVKRLGTSMVMELIRMIEAARLRALGSSPAENADSATGWGGSAATGVGVNPLPTAADREQYAQFLQQLQASFMKEFTAGNMARSYTTRN